MCRARNCNSLESKVRCITPDFDRDMVRMMYSGNLIVCKRWNPRERQERLNKLLEELYRLGYETQSLIPHVYEWSYVVYHVMLYEFDGLFKKFVTRARIDEDESTIANGR